MNRSIALILAGGVGSRMQLSIPKQFVVVDGLTVLQHTMLAFQRHQLVSAIYVVTSSQWHDDVHQQAKDAGISKFACCFCAGENSFQSAKNGILSLKEKEDENCVILIHDAVRPLVSQDIINRNIAVCLSRGNAITALQSQESYMVIDEDANRSDKEIVSSSHILREKLLIKTNGRIKIINQFICFFCKSSTPQLCHFTSSIKIKSKFDVNTKLFIMQEKISFYA